jgi:hypothetical protein
MLSPLFEPLNSVILKDLRHFQLQRAQRRVLVKKTTRTTSVRFNPLAEVHGDCIVKMALMHTYRTGASGAGDDLVLRH